MSLILKKLLFFRTEKNENPTRWYYLAFDSQSNSFVILSVERKNEKVVEDLISVDQFLSLAGEEAKTAFYQTLDNILG